MTSVTQALPCPVCTHTDYKIDYANDAITFGHCRRCGLAYTTPLAPDGHHSVNGEKVIRTKDSYNSGMFKGFARLEAAARVLAKERAAFYQKQLGRRPRNLLDVGAGSGSFYRGFSEAGIAWEGIDINPEMVAFCQQQNIPVTHAEFTTFTGKPPYDVIFSSQVLEHILEPHAFLNHARSLLAPDGILHLDVPNHGSLTSLLRKTVLKGEQYGFLQPPYHLLAYSKPCLTQLLTECGFTPQIVRSHRNDHKIFGQTHVTHNLRQKSVYALSDLLGMGSLLVAIARPQS